MIGGTCRSRFHHGLSPATPPNKGAPDASKGDQQYDSAEPHAGICDVAHLCQYGHLPISDQTAGEGSRWSRINR